MVKPNDKNRAIYQTTDQKEKMMQEKRQLNRVERLKQVREVEKVNF